MQATPPQEIKTKIFTSPMAGHLENQLTEFLSSQAMKEATVLDIKYSGWQKDFSTFSILLIYKFVQSTAQNS